MIDAWNINVLMGRFLQFRLQCQTPRKMCWLQQDTRSRTPRMPQPDLRLRTAPARLRRRYPAGSHQYKQEQRGGVCVGGYDDTTDASRVVPLAMTRQVTLKNSGLQKSSTSSYIHNRMSHSRIHNFTTATRPRTTGRSSNKAARRRILPCLHACQGLRAWQYDS